MHLQESGEMYLETILVLSQKMSVVRSVDVAEYMGYTKPSVSRAISLLKNANYVIMDKHGYLTLTEDGQKIAKKIYERHTLLTQFLMRLGVDEKTASEDACKMEHIISDNRAHPEKGRQQKRIFCCRPFFTSFFYSGSIHPVVSFHHHRQPAVLYLNPPGSIQGLLYIPDFHDRPRF